MLTRRHFLGQGATGLSAVALQGMIPALFARAAESAAQADKSDRVLVVVELAGGNDGLNTVVPFENDLYYKNRPTLAVAKEQALRLNDQLGLHPALAPLHPLFDKGQLAVVQGVGYPEPDRSHFRSMEIWHTASTGRSRTGWLGRYFDRPGQATPPSTLAGVALTDQLPQALQAERFVAPVVSSLEALDSAVQDTVVSTALLRELSQSRGKANGAAAFISQQANETLQTAEQLRSAAGRYQATVTYPETPLGIQLRRAAQIIQGDLGTRVLFASQDGYDTHATQADPHQALLTDLAGALAAFQSDLAQLGLADKVVTMVFSEFGRRVDENASHGTDHGAASCLFTLGPQVKGGVIGEHPSLEKLDDGDLIYHTDFRAVYATILDRWLMSNSAELLGAKFAPLDFLPAANT
ncbi:MAG: DUF1501 domain-containing protein [Planctomycetes bacterium]|nr:DUF1501 domain-containing protein [Planctomycetota bacterium]